MKIKGIHVFVGTVTSAVFVAVVLGFWAIGSPELQRSKNLDRQRVSDMQSIAGAIDSYWYYRKTLPASLDELQGNQRFYVQSVKDPVTQQTYEYSSVSSTTYRLCVTFDLPSDDAAKSVSTPYAYGSWTSEGFWKHGQGYQCFDLEVSQAPDAKIMY